MGWTLHELHAKLAIDCDEAETVPTRSFTLNALHATPVNYEHQLQTNNRRNVPLASTAVDAERSADLCSSFIALPLSVLINISICGLTRCQNLLRTDVSASKTNKSTCLNVDRGATTFGPTFFYFFQCFK